MILFHLIMTRALFYHNSLDRSISNSRGDGEEVERGAGCGGGGGGAWLALIIAMFYRNSCS